MLRTVIEVLSVKRRATVFLPFKPQRTLRFCGEKQVFTVGTLAHFRQFAYPEHSSIPDENWLDTFSPDMCEISVGAHSCAMHSWLKAAPTITLSERELLRCSWVRT